MDITLKQLWHAATLAEAGTYSAAADRLHISQPALSRSIQALEARLGVRLFDRSHTGVEPTSLGRLVLERGRGLLTDAADLEREIRLAVGLDIGRLTVGVAPYPAEISVGNACARFVARHPGVALDVQSADWQVLTRRVLDGQLDLAIAELSIAREDERLVAEDLPHHTGFMFVRAGHPLADADAIDLASVLDYPVVSSSLPERLKRLGPTIRVDTVSLMRQIVIESDAVGIATRRQVVHQLDAGTIVPLPLDLPWLRTDYGFIRLARRTPSPAMLAFMELTREAERSLVESAAPP